MGSQHLPQGLFKGSLQQGQFCQSSLRICSNAGLSCQALLPNGLLNIWVPCQLKESHYQGEGCLQEPQKSQSLSPVIHKENPFYKRMPLSGQGMTLGTMTLNPEGQATDNPVLATISAPAGSAAYNPLWYWGRPSGPLRDNATHIYLSQCLMVIHRPLSTDLTAQA